MNKSVIDLTFCTPSLRTNIVNWCTDEKAATGSDHANIRLDMVSKEAFSAQVSATARHNWKKADWDKFTLSLNNLAELTLPRWNVLMETQTEDNEYLETAAISPRLLARRTICGTQRRDATKVTTTQPKIIESSSN